MKRGTESNNNTMSTPRNWPKWQITASSEKLYYIILIHLTGQAITS